MRSERADLKLQSTALVHEVYLRLTKAHDVTWNDRAHFFALSAEIMRRTLGLPRIRCLGRRRAFPVPRWSDEDTQRVLVELVVVQNWADELRRLVPPES